MRKRLFVLLLAGIAPGTAYAQSTRPADASLSAQSRASRVPVTVAPATPETRWRQTVDALATRLADSSDPTPDDVASSDTARPDTATAVPAIHSFANPTLKVGFEQLRERAAGATVVAVLTYRTPPKTLASDMAAALRDSSLPDSVKADLTPPDAESSDRANRVAAAWVGRILSPAPDEPVALLVLYPTSEGNLLGGQAEAPGPRAPVFVLLKGHFLPDASAPVRHIVFGDPRETPTK